MMAEQLAQTSKGMTSNYMVACATEWQDLYGFWENRKVLEFYFDIVLGLESPEKRLQVLDSLGN